MNQTRITGFLPHKGGSALSNYLRRVQASAHLLHVVKTFERTIMEDPFLRMGLTQAINEAVVQYSLPYRDIHELCLLINTVIQEAVPFQLYTDMVGCPLNALLDWPMCMPSGYEVFRNAKFNEAMKLVLQFWCEFLSSERSRTYLNDEEPAGWFSETAWKTLALDDFQVDMSKPFGGFDSWNSFFVRKFKPEARPIASPQDDMIVVNACESKPFNLQHRVKLIDNFWLKGQPYSLVDIFGGPGAAFAPAFISGDVYQAFLSAFNFHRWNSPVNGRIIAAYNLEGTYYSESPCVGEDPAGPDNSQGYITAVAARAVVVIEANNPLIGLMACVFVGMSEISSCKITVNVDQQVNKGDELGYFQYGGSTHLIIFRQGVIQRWLPALGNEASIQKVNSPLALVKH